MTFWRLVLAGLGLGYAGFGFAFLFSPSELAAFLSLTFSDPSARTDFRAMYGGLEIGLGGFMLACAVRREFVRIGLFAAACATVGMATARTVGMMLDGVAFSQLVSAVVEWGICAVATWGALVARPDLGMLPPPVTTPVGDAAP
jgi:hypothetical protein